MTLMYCKLLWLFKNVYVNILFSFVLVILLLTLFGNRDEQGVIDHTFNIKTEEETRKAHLETTSWFFSYREKTNTSNLGSWLFKQEHSVKPQDKTFSILVWHYWQNLRTWEVSENGHLEHCSVQNCIFTTGDGKLETADAVIINLARGDIPKVKHRNPLQRWIFLSDKSPVNVFAFARKQMNLKDLANVFNWSMTYRSDADIPVPYGRTVALHEPVFQRMDKNTIKKLIPNWHKKRRDVLASILSTNCYTSPIMKHVTNLRKYMPIDVFGECQNIKTNNFFCSGYRDSDCAPISEYLFYLAFENSCCREYLTEKIWYYAYKKGAIPIIMGPPISDCIRLLPPNSFVYIPKYENNATIKDLASHIVALGNDDDSLLSLHQWRNHFKVYNEHGYFRTQSQHLCRVCEAMNYNDAAGKIYGESDLREFLDPKLTCKTPQ